MANQNHSRGKCVFCQEEKTRTGMAKHLPACQERRQAIVLAERKGGNRQALYHLQIQDVYGHDYWLHLEMNGKAKLEDLDDYLRAIWLECCGHLSRFSVGGWRSPEIDMGSRADRVFKPGLELLHIYDFGTSSKTTVKVVGVREGIPLTFRPIYLMARNDQRVEACKECGQPASWLCIECLYNEEESGTLCDLHAENHPHEEYGGPTPLVNSPRVGLCGYDGPADPPY